MIKPRARVQRTLTKQLNGKIKCGGKKLKDIIEHNGQTAYEVPSIFKKVCLKEDRKSVFSQAQLNRINADWKNGVPTDWSTSILIEMGSILSSVSIHNELSIPLIAPQMQNFASLE